ncbi:hypothetical protein [Mangrovicoccus sp. HB161399]|uniref:hypothetical protein n=1 Tax=Mangrovicoccus sp. HB161399 TaxID=2720392 RepID=UPI001C12EC0F
MTRRGTKLADSPGSLFGELIPFFVPQIDHASSARFDDRPVGSWDIWMNVINVEADHGTTEAALVETLYGEPHDWHTGGWREKGAFSSCVLRPPAWAGLISEILKGDPGSWVSHVFKTPLWRSAIRLETDAQIAPICVQ